VFIKGDGNGHFKVVNASNSGFFASGDVKDMSKIKIQNEDFILAVKNNDSIQAIKVN
jgi:hypothetical protein